MPTRICTCVAVFAAVLSAQQPDQPTKKVFERIGAIPTVGGMIADVCFPSGGKKMLTVGGSGDLVLWDFATLRPIAQPTALPGRHSFRAAAHPAGSVVALSCEDSLILHDLGSGRREPIPIGQRIKHLEFSPSGRALVAVTDDARRPRAVILTGPLDILGAKHRRRVIELPEHWSGAPKFSRDERTLCINQSQNSNVHLRVDLSNPTTPVSEHDGQMVGYSADGRLATLDDAEGGLEIALGAKKVRLDKPHEMIRFGNWRPVVRGGRAIWVAGLQKLRVREPGAEADAELSFPGALHFPVFKIAPDGSPVVVDNQHRLHVVRNGKVHTLGAHRGTPLSLSFSPDGRHVAAVGPSATVIASVSGQRAHRIYQPTAVVPGDRGPEFLIVEPDRTTLWNAATQRPIRGLARPRRPLQLVLPMPSIQLCRARSFGDRRFVLVVCDPDKLGGPRRLHVLDRKSGSWTELENSNKSSNRRPGDAAARPGSREVAIAHVMPVLVDGLLTGPIPEGPTLVIRSADGALRRPIPLHSGPSALAFREDGTRLFVSEQDGTARVFTAPDYRQVTAVKHEAELSAAQWIHGDRILGFDGSHLVLLDARRLLVKTRLPLPKPTVPCTTVKWSIDPPPIAWSADLRYLAIGRAYHVEIYRMRLPGQGRAP